MKQFFKNPKIWQTAVALVCFAIISIAFFYPDAAEGNSLRQHDMMQGAAIGNEVQTYEQETGVKSWWTNSLFGGMPVYQISPTYSSDSLIGWITTVYGAGLPSPSNLLFMMMTGFFILMLAMNVRWKLGMLGAVAWGLSSYFVIIIGAGHIWKFVTLAYIPPTIAGVILCYEGKLLRGAAVAALFAAMQIASNHIQMSYYFLFVILGLSIAYLWSAWKGGNVAGWLRSTGVLLCAAVIAVMANLPTLYNTYAYSKNSMRGQHSELTAPQAAGESSEVTSGLDRDYITQYSYGRSESFTLMIPDIKGGASARPVGGQMEAMSLSDLDKANELGEIERQYLQYVSQYFGEPESTNGPVYVGVIICALFLLGCIVVKGPVKWALVALTVLSLLLAMGRNCQWLTDLFIDYVPLYNKFRTVESILVIAEFTMPLLAVLGLREYLGQEKRGLKPVGISFGIVGFFCLVALVFPSVYGSFITPQDEQISQMISGQLLQQGYPAQQAAMFSLDNPAVYQAVKSLRAEMVQSDALRSIIFLGISFIALFAFATGRLKRSYTVVALGVFVLADLYTVDKRYVSHDSFCSPQLTASDPFPLTQADRAILADSDPHYRVFDIPQFYAAAPSYRHKAIGGYHAAKLTRYQDLIDRHLGNFPAGVPSEADLNVANMLNAKYFVYGPDKYFLNEGAGGNAWFAHSLKFVDTPDQEMDALGSILPTVDAVADRRFSGVLTPPSAPAEGDTIRLTKYAPDRLEYRYKSAAGGLAVLSEVYYPDGWHAEVDGEPVEIGRVNYILRAVNVPAGEHTLILTFSPESVTSTVTVAYVAIALIYLLVIAAIVCGIRRGCRRD